MAVHQENPHKDGFPTQSAALSAVTNGFTQLENGKTVFQEGHLTQTMEARLMELMQTDYAWEQIIYDIIAAEGLDPWNLDISILSDSFMKYVKKVKELDFRIPAKYVMITSMMLRMKSDYLKLTDIPGEGCLDIGVEDDMLMQPEHLGINNFSIDGINFPEKRTPAKSLMVTDLINAIKKAIATQDRKELKKMDIRQHMKFEAENITERINKMYQRIDLMAAQIKNGELEFSKLVPKWEKKEIIEAFLPMIYLDNEKKINCRQAEIFKEIFIKKLN